MTDEISDKSRTVALLLAFVLGVFGAHRFYAGRTRSAVLMALTLGGAGIWWLYDVILVASGEFRDVHERRIAEWEGPAALPGQIPMEVLHELDQLRQAVAELNERVDFTERLLAAKREERLGE